MCMNRDCLDMVSWSELRMWWASHCDGGLPTVTRTLWVNIVVRTVPKPCLEFRREWRQCIQNVGSTQTMAIGILKHDWPQQPHAQATTSSHPLWADNSLTTWLQQLIHVFQRWIWWRFCTRSVAQKEEWLSASKCVSSILISPAICQNVTGQDTELLVSFLSVYVCMGECDL